MEDGVRLSRVLEQAGGMNPDLMVEARRRLRRRFVQQRVNAKNRGIEWRLTFEEWRDWWLLTGHVDERGRHRGQWAMARPGDVGPYELGNIVCMRAEDNSREGNVTKARMGEYDL
jgi:hypothetical protein